MGDVHGRCAWEMRMGDVHGRCVWEMCMGDVHGRCAWEMCMGDVYGRYVCLKGAEQSDAARDVPPQEVHAWLAGAS